MELPYVICAFIPAEFGLNVKLSITQLMVTDHRCFVLWKCGRLEMFRACHLVHLLVRWRYQGVFAGL